MIKIEEIKQKLTINPDTRKCFIFDLDGTIVFNNEMLSPTNQNILQKIIDYGHEIIFATGRSYRDFKVVMPKQFHNHKATFFSGALTQDNAGNIRRSVPLPKAYVEEIMQFCLKHKSFFVIDNVSHYYYPPPEDDAILGILDSQIIDYRVNNIDKMLETDIYKILVFDMQLYKNFMEYAKSNNLVVKYHSYDNLFDIMAAKCNKYQGVLPLLEDFTHNDIFIFGNDFNDYEILDGFQNSVVFGSIAQLLQISKLNIPYDVHQENNFSLIIDTILAA
ncbi:MAG: hypothetical protein K0R49_865 [Burkholderiales bacterium]|jgi:Cof subfamily protein (haloacid dehalogenase superfamily)|nr:hypothetical protein [Burkholderiales bacterium]